MEIRELHDQSDFERYKAWVEGHPQGNLWQSIERKKYLESLGHTVRMYVAVDDGIKGSALVMIDRTSFGLSVWDIPRGPIGSYQEELVAHIVNEAKKDKCLSLFYSPIKHVQYSKISSHQSKRHTHAEATLIIDLTQSEDDILRHMKQKGRYNIKVAEKNNVSVEESDDIDAFFGLVSETSKRDEFVSLPRSKYEAFLQHLDGSFLLLAYDEKKTPIAGVLSVIWNKKAIYYYGASSYAHRAFMAPYLLQWRSIQLCKQRGATSYDLLGIAPPHSGDDHPWKGITSFKEKFGGDVVEYPPEQQIILKPLMNWVINLKRKFF